MWISRALFEARLVSSVRDSFTPNVDGFDEENGKRERGKFVKKVSRFEESSYVKRTSQFYCPTPSEVESLDANCNKSQRQKQLQQLLHEEQQLLDEEQQQHQPEGFEQQQQKYQKQEVQRWPFQKLEKLFHHRQQQRHGQQQRHKQQQQRHEQQQHHGQQRHEQHQQHHAQQQDHGQQQQHHGQQQHGQQHPHEQDQPLEHQHQQPLYRLQQILYNTSQQILWHSAVLATAVSSSTIATTTNATSPSSLSPTATASSTQPQENHKLKHFSENSFFDYFEKSESEKFESVEIDLSENRVYLRSKNRLSDLYHHFEKKVNEFFQN